MAAPQDLFAEPVLDLPGALVASFASCSGVRRGRRACRSCRRDRRSGTRLRPISAVDVSGVQSRPRWSARCLSRDRAPRRSVRRARCVLLVDRVMSASKSGSNSARPGDVAAASSSARGREPCGRRDATLCKCSRPSRVTCASSRNSARTSGRCGRNQGAPAPRQEPGTKVEDVTEERAGGECRDPRRASGRRAPS